MSATRDSSTGATRNEGANRHHGTRPEGIRGLTITRGTFSSRRAVTTAVQRLGEESVPADSITVTRRGGAGDLPDADLSVEDEGGALRGGLVGAACGAVVGVVIVVAGLAGLFGPPGAEPFAIGTLIGAVRAIASTAVAGVPLGVLLGMGRWKGHRAIESEDLGDRNVVVSVVSDDLADVARRVLVESGASNVIQEAGAAS